MRRIVLYIRQAFCVHEFNREEGFMDYDGEFSRRSGTRVYLYCPKCGYTRKHWKWM